MKLISQKNGHLPLHLWDAIDFVPDYGLAVRREYGKMWAIVNVLKVLSHLGFQNRNCRQQDDPSDFARNGESDA